MLRDSTSATRPRSRPRVAARAGPAAPAAAELPSGLRATPSTLSDHLCIDFVNSRFSDHTGSGQVYDRLVLEEWRTWFVNRSGLTAAPSPSVRSRDELMALRHLIRRLLESGTQPDAAAVAQLNRCLAWSSQSSELVRLGGRHRLLRRWNHAGWPAVMAAVAASYAGLLDTGGIRRVRVCANPHCSYVFYDDTRNASRRWCDAALCGNLVKVRRHRAENAAGAAGKGGARRRPGQPPARRTAPTGG